MIYWCVLLRNHTQSWQIFKTILSNSSSQQQQQQETVFCQLPREKESVPGLLWNFTDRYEKEKKKRRRRKRTGRRTRRTRKFLSSDDRYRRLWLQGCAPPRDEESSCHGQREALFCAGNLHGHFFSFLFFLFLFQRSYWYTMLPMARSNGRTKTNTRERKEKRRKWSSSGESAGTRKKRERERGSAGGTRRGCWREQSWNNKTKTSSEPANQPSQPANQIAS